MMMNEPSRKKTVIYTGKCINSKCMKLISYCEGTAWLKCSYCDACFESKYIQNPSIAVRGEETDVSGISPDGPNGNPGDGNEDEEGEVCGIQYDPTEWANVEQIAAAAKGYVGVTTDGRVLLSKSLVKQYSSKVQTWAGVCAVAFDGDAIIALTKDGTVYIARWSTGLDDRETLFDLTAIAATPQLTVGIDKEGKVKSFYRKKRQNKTDAWSNVCAVAVSEQDDVVALMKDGCVDTVNFQGKAAIDVLAWRNIVQVAAGKDFIVGLTKKGKVLSAARDSRSVPTTSTWKEIISIATSKDFVVGLKKNGEVLCSAQNSHSVPDTSTWKDIQRIAACNGVVIGMTRTGEWLKTGKFN